MMLFAVVHTLVVLGMVGTLQLYRHWLFHIGYDNPAIAYRPAYGLAPLFALMFVAGLALGFMGTSKGLALSLGISGLLGFCFLVEMLMRFATGRLHDCREMDRVVLEDL